MFAHVAEAIRAAERSPTVRTRDDAFAALRGLGLDEFAEILLHSPLLAFPKIARLLPRMPSDEVQLRWNGASGYALLRQSCGFVRSCAANYARLTGRYLGDGTVLDYGCGWGRLARLFYYFVNTPDLIGVDPWNRSLDVCAASGLVDTFRRSEPLPVTLPVDEMRFDFAYSFSVFTHLSEQAAMAALAAVRAVMKPGGVFCITVRPLEYWDIETGGAPTQRRRQLKRRQAEGRFAFFPHGRGTEEASLFGDAGVPLAWLRLHAAGWRIIGIDRALDDPHQLLVFMRVEGA